MYIEHNTRNKEKFDCNYVRLEKHKSNLINIGNLEQPRLSGFIIGRANSDDKLKVVDKLRYLFVSRIAEQVDSNSLKQYINKQVEGNFEITKLRSKRPGYSSYKVGVPISLWEKIYSPDFWPSGAFVNRFRYNRKNFSSGSDFSHSFLEQGDQTDPRS
ncbi:hypothetical protein J6590_035946 [Homalodisca vitripennis]|nr:hypothetical protein J6590_035946 [Homalodisca vitripennis]